MRLDRENPSAVGVTCYDYLQLRAHGSEKDRLGCWVYLNEWLGKECGGVRQNLHLAGLPILSVLAEVPSEPVSSGGSQEEEVRDWTNSVSER